MTRGKYIVLEGPEGAGKTSQLQELARRMRAAGLPVRTLREPDSQSDLTARAIRQLTQDPQYPMNTRTEVLLYNAARSQSLEAIRNSLEHGVHCLVDRNYLTTLAVQFYGRGDVPDYYTINSIINFAVGGLEPDLTIILDAPVQILRQRSTKRNNIERFDDLDNEFLERVRAGYLWEAKQRSFPLVYASKEFEEVANDIWRLVSKTLSARAGHSAEISQPASVAEVINEKITENQPVSATDDSPKNAEVQGLISADNSRLELNAASKLLINQLYAARSNSCIGLVATEDNYGDKDSSGHYKYYLPENFKAPVLRKYTSSLDRIFDNYRQMSDELTKYLRTQSKRPKAKQDKKWRSATRRKAARALQAVLPVSAVQNVELAASVEALKPLILGLKVSDSLEADKASRNILAAARLILPDFLPEFEKTVKPAQKNQSQGQTMQKLANQYLPPSHTDDPASSLSMIDISPRNELDLVADAIYEYSDESIANLRKLAAGWNYSKKSKVLETYCRALAAPAQMADSVLDHVTYSWDLVQDYGVFAELQRHLVEANLVWQPLTPRYGYDVPQLIEDAGLTDKFEECFDISLQLFSQLQAAGFTYEAQYATLEGHRLRARLTASAREAINLVRLGTTTNDYPGYREFLSELKSSIQDVHPLLADFTFGTKATKSQN